MYSAASRGAGSAASHSVGPGDSDCFHRIISRSVPTNNRHAYFQPLEYTLFQRDVLLPGMNCPARASATLIPVRGIVDSGSKKWILSPC